MIQRPREHVLEDESRRAFEAALPAEWVRRPQVPDYGLDEEVQIFKNGLATHLRFLAQLKGTDTPSKSGKSIKYRFSCRHLRYWADSTTPVMLVVYDAQKKILFYEWARQSIKELGPDERMNFLTRETITLKLQKKLIAGQHAQLERELRHLYFQSGAPTTAVGPLRIRIDVTHLPENTPASSNLQPDNLQATLRSWLARVLPGKSVILDSQEPDVFFELQLTKGVFILHHQTPPLEIPLSKEEAKDLVSYEKEVVLTCKLLASFQVAASGLVAQARVMLEALITTEEQFHSGMAVYMMPFVAQIFARGEHASHALDIAEFLLDKGAHDAAVMLSTAAPLQGFDSKSASPLLAQRYRRLLKEVLKSETLPGRKAICHYNLANNLRATGHHKEAIAQYILAARADDSYLSRSYWWAEIAGCLYLTNRRRLSLFHYEAARDMGETRIQVRALIGDVLLHLGRFKQAAASFDEHVTAGNYLPAEFVLKRWLAGYFGAKFGDTRRQVGLALRTAQKGYSKHGPQTQFLEEAVRLDPLCDYAWFNYAHWKSELDPEHKHEYWLSAAILSPWDIEAQVNGIGALQEKKDKASLLLFSALLAEVYRRNPAALEEELLKRKLLTSPNQQEALRDVRTMMSHAEKLQTMFSTQSSEPPFALRFFGLETSAHPSRR